MLKQRVITAIAMLLILLPALFDHSPAPFCAIALVMIAAGAWEWARLNAYGPVASVLSGAVCVVVCVTLWQIGLLEKSLPLLWLAAGSVWVLAGAWVLRSGVSASWP
jgi:phosphatidate cytidylyltransferase